MKYKRFFPVIHCQSFNQVKQNLDLIKSYQDIDFINGVFLINHHSMDEHQFIRLIENVVINYQEYDFLIGINDLGFNVREYNNLYKNQCKLLHIIFNTGIKMLWTDNAGYDEAIQEKSWSENILKETASLFSEKKIEFFGGIHFKYQPKPQISLKESIEMFHKHYSKLTNGIVTLSGPATGIPINLQKINVARQHCSELSDNLRIALASGINFDNLSDFWKNADDFLVASSLLKDDGSEIFSEEKINYFKYSFKNNLLKYNE